MPMTMIRFGCIAVGRIGLCYGPFWLYDGPFWTTQWAVFDNFLGFKILGAVLVGAVLAMGRIGIDPTLCLRNKHCTKLNTAVLAIPYC